MNHLLVLVLIATATLFEQAPETPPAASARIHVRGRVLDVKGKPIESGAIEILRLDTDESPRETERQATGTELKRKGAGRFELDVEGPCELTWKGTDERRRTIIGALVESREAAADEYEIIVATLVGVGGTLVNEDGKHLECVDIRQRVSNAWLAEISGSSPARRRWQPAGDLEGLGGIGEDGGFHFEFPSIPDSALEVVSFDDVLVSKPLPEKGVQDLRIVVENDVVNGVLMRPNGTPVAGARIFDGHVEAVTDARGKFTWEPGVHISSDTQLKIAERDGAPANFMEFGRQWKARDKARPFRIISAGFPEALRGELRNADGTPAAGWLIVITETSAPAAPANPGIELQELPRATTDAKGAFLIQGIPAGAHALFLRSPDDLIAFKATGVRGDQGDVVLRVPERAVVPIVRARVVTMSGEPIPNVRVTFDVVYPHGYPSGPGKRSANSDSDGWLEVRDVSREATGMRVLDLDPRYMPIDWQSWQPLVLDADDHATIRVSPAALVRFERRRLDLEAERIVVFDSAGQEMVCQVRWRVPGEANTSSPGIATTVLGLDGHFSPEFLVGAEAEYLGVFSNQGEIERFPLHLTTTGLNRVAWR